MRSDWVLPLCTGHERIKDAQGDKAHPTQKPESLLHRLLVGLDQPRRRGPGPVLRHRHDRRRGQDAGPRFHRDRARGGLSQGRQEARDRPRAQVRPRGAAGQRVQQAVRSRACPSARSVERGMLRPGEELISPRGATAKVRADGSLISSDAKGSIHQVGAALEGAPACNGWTYWNFKRDGKMVSIDILRQQIRAPRWRQRLSPAPTDQVYRRCLWPDHEH